MESLGDILKRLTQRSTSDGTGAQEPVDPAAPPPGDPACPVCHGLGWVRMQVPVNHPDFGKATPCQCRRPVLEVERKDRLRRMSSLGPLSRITFETTLPDGRSADDPVARSHFRAALDAARAYAEDPQGWLVLVGPSGCGKTHLAAAVTNRAIEHGVPVLFVLVPDLLDHLRGAFAPSAEVPYDEMFEQVKRVPLLVLDDLGIQSSTPWATEKLYQVLNHRYVAKLPTIFTLAVPLDRLDENLRTRLTAPEIARVVQVGVRTKGLLTQIPENAITPEMRKQMTFESFDVRGNGADAEGRASLEMAVRGARAYADDPQGWLVLIGPPGTGKTHLAVAIMSRLLARDEAVSFVRVADLMDHLRATFAPDSQVRYDELFERVKTAPFLVLDDLGSERSTPWAEEKLYQIVVHRHDSRLPTVITTYAHLDDMRPGVASRLRDVRVVNTLPIGAPDYRSHERLSPAPGASARGQRVTYPRQGQQPQGGQRGGKGARRDGE